MQLIKLNLKNKNFKIHQLYLGRINNYSGRNNQGCITMKHRGGGVKKLNRFINFKYLVWGLNAIVLTIEYAVKRTGYISLICYANGILSYILATDTVKIGDSISIGNYNNNYNVDLNYKKYKGHVVQLKYLIDGVIIHNLEINYLFGSQFVRAAGSNAQIIKSNYNLKQSLIKLPSGEERLVSNNCIATIGQVSNIKHSLRKFHKAGQIRNLGFRPIVRGVAMNPVDHPHGGGQGKTSGAGGFRSQVTFKGLIAKNSSTRYKKKYTPYILTYRKKKN